MSKANAAPKSDPVVVEAHQVATYPVPQAYFE